MATINTRTQTLDRQEIEAFVPRGNFRTVKAFENLFEDVANTIPSAIETSVQGPAGGAVDDNVVVFDGVSGVRVKDSGVSIDDIALLESPAFTGTPTAPTAASGSNTQQLANTAFVQGELADFVEGPATATDDAIALFDGTSGKLIQDSGVLIASLAPLASPTFTGDPKAPTAAVGDNDTSIATTGFVQGEFAERVAAGSYFSAHNNGSAQTLTTATFTKLTMGTEVFDVGSDFASSTWTPPSGRPVMLDGAMTITSVAGALITVMVYKNGAEYKRGTMQQTQGTGPVTCTVSCIDVPNGTDTYELYGYQATGVNQDTIGNAELTYFQGTTIQA